MIIYRRCQTKCESDPAENNRKVVNTMIDVITTLQATKGSDS